MMQAGGPVILFVAVAFEDQRPEMVVIPTQLAENRVHLLLERAVIGVDGTGAVVHIDEAGVRLRQVVPKVPAETLEP